MKLRSDFNRTCSPNQLATNLSLTKYETRTCSMLESLQTGILLLLILLNKFCCSLSGDVAAAMGSSELLNALEWDPDRSSPELSVRDEPTPESDLSTSLYEVVAEPLDKAKEDDNDEDDEEDVDFISNAGLAAATRYCCC